MYIHILYDNNGKRGCELEREQEGEGLEGEKGRNQCCNYIIISINNYEFMFRKIIACSFLCLDVLVWLY